MTIQTMTGARTWDVLSWRSLVRTEGPLTEVRA